MQSGWKVGLMLRSQHIAFIAQRYLSKLAVIKQ